MGGLSLLLVEKDMPDLNLPEKAMATQVGMDGRVWFGQGLVYDEIYQFLQDLSILDKPNEKKAADAPGSGQTPLAGGSIASCNAANQTTRPKATAATVVSIAPRSRLRSWGTSTRPQRSR